MGSGEIAVSLNAPPKKIDCFGVRVLAELCAPDKGVPQVHAMVAGRKAKRRSDMDLGLLGSTYEIFGLTDARMCPSEISIQLQCPLEFSDALSHPVRIQVEGAQNAVRLRMIRREGQHFHQSRFP